MNGGLLLHGITSDTDCAWTTYCMHHWEKILWPNSTKCLRGGSMQMTKMSNPARPTASSKTNRFHDISPHYTYWKKSNAAHLKYDFKHWNLGTSWTKLRLYNWLQQSEPKNLFTLAKKGISNSPRGYAYGWRSCKVSNALFFIVIFYSVVQKNERGDDVGAKCLFTYNITHPVQIPSIHWHGVLETRSI